MNDPWLPVRRRPRIALLSSGDELVRPGEHIGPNQIVSSNGLAIAAFVRRAGGIPVDLGIAADTEESVQRTADAARNCDMLVTLGGASVGKHDLIQDVLAAGGDDLQFWKIAMRPGKPLMAGHLGKTKVLGLPGNPVSSLVCGLLFLKPLIKVLLGLPGTEPHETQALLGADLKENDRRQDYIRAELASDGDGQLTVTPFAKQDSSMLALLARSSALIIRPPLAPALKAGEPVPILRL